MSEKILKALMQLFAIITKQDGGVTDNERRYVKDFLESQLEQEKIEEYFSLYENFLIDDTSSSLKEKNKNTAKDENILIELSEEEKAKKKLKLKRRKRREALLKLELERDGITSKRTSRTLHRYQPG